MAFKLDPTCAVGGEIIRAIREQLAGCIDEVGERETSAKTRIHHARTSCKKARAALKLIRSDNPKAYRRENRWLRDSARELSSLRDADAILESLTALRKRFPAPSHAHPFGSLRRALLAHRRVVQPSAREIEGRLTVFAQRLREASRRLRRWKPRMEFSAVAGSFCHAYKRSRGALRKVRDHPGAETFHEWRKATKAYGYQCQMLRAAWRPAMKALQSELKALASLLGDEHDLTVLRDRLATLGDKGELKADHKNLRLTIALLNSHQESLRRQAILLGERLFADSPRIIGKRMTRWWRVAEEEARGRASRSG